ncbi:calcium/sodium antiporter [Planctomycetota bacterium]
MEILLHIGYLLLGIALLYWGGEFLVTGSSRIAESFGVRKIIIGLTLVAFGTSAPELVVSGLASLGGYGEMALGNIVGSNIANIGLVLGLTAMIVPLTIEPKVLRWEVPLMILASAVFFGMCQDGELDRVDGIILLVLFVMFIYTCMINAKETGGTVILRRLRPKQKLSLAGLSLLGLVMLGGGGKLLVDGGVFFAKSFGIPEFIIGLTMLAIGTSLPELVVSLIAAFRKSSDLSVGNVVGSNIFNIMLVLGVVAIIRPLPVGPEEQFFHLPVMLGFAFLTFPLMRRGLRLSRFDGTIIFSCFVLYYVLLFTVFKP